MTSRSRRVLFSGLFAVLAVGRAWADSAPVLAQGAWMRPAAAGANGAVYLTIVNHGRFGDTLTGMASPDAASANLHESRLAGGVMSMRPLASLAIPADGAAALKPAGLHIMLQGLKHGLKSGDRATLLLTFAKAGRVRVLVNVRAMVAADPMAGMKM